ncbi:hypothetical protein HMI56_005082, partial [Coelomomyces lativittatus]
MDFKRFNLVWVFCTLFVSSITYVSLTPSDASASDKCMMNQSKLRKRQIYPTKPSFQPPVYYQTFSNPSNYQPSTYNEEYSYSPIYQSSYYNRGYPYFPNYQSSYYNGGYPYFPNYQSSYYNGGYPYSLYFPPSYYNWRYPYSSYPSTFAYYGGKLNFPNGHSTYSHSNDLRNSFITPYSFSRQASSSPYGRSLYSTNANLFNSPSWPSSSHRND